MAGKPDRQGRGWRIALVVSLALNIAVLGAIGGWALFILAFHTRFPPGPFEQLMRSVL